jgi:hypothetical protein
MYPSTYLSWFRRLLIDNWVQRTRVREGQVVCDRAITVDCLQDRER